MTNQTVVEKELKANWILDKIDLEGEICVYNSTVTLGDQKIFNDTGIALKEDIEKAKPFETIKKIDKLRLFKKEFIEKYVRISFPDDDYDKLLDECIVKNVYEVCRSLDNLDDYVLLIYDRNSETIYDINNKNLKHAVRYNNNCYNVTDKEYKLRELLKYLKESENVIITSDGIEPIPYYNADYANKFIDFKVILEGSQLDQIENQKEMENQKGNKKMLMEKFFDIKNFLKKSSK